MTIMYMNIFFMIMENILFHIILIPSNQIEKLMKKVIMIVKIQIEKIWIKMIILMKNLMEI